MQLSYSGQEQVQAPPALVWAFVDDPQRVAACLPRVDDLRVVGPHQLEAHIAVGAGLLRGKIKLDITVQPDQQGGKVTVTVRGGGLGSQLNLNAVADVVDNQNGTTNLNWQGQAEASGPLAKMGGQMIDAQAQQLIARTFQRMSESIGAEAKKLA